MAKVTFTRENLTVDARVGDKIHDLAVEHGADILFGCIDGLCGTCIVTVEEGMEHLNKKEQNEEDTLKIMGGKENQRLACQLKIVSDGHIKLKVDY